MKKTILAIFILMGMEKFSRIPKKSDFLNNKGVGLHGLYPILLLLLSLFFIEKKYDIENINFLKDSHEIGFLEQ